MTRAGMVAVAGLGSAVMLAAALGSQYILGLAPCELCIWQRWPHAAAVVIMALALLLPGRIWPLLGMVAALTTAGIGGFHMGVEQGWWPGPAACTGGTLGNISMADLLNPDATAPAPPRCDEVAWALFGLSMAGWNMLASLGLAAVWGLAAQRRA